MQCEDSATFLGPSLWTGHFTASRAGIRVWALAAGRPCQPRLIETVLPQPPLTQVLARGHSFSTSSSPVSFLTTPRQVLSLQLNVATSYPIFHQLFSSSRSLTCGEFLLAPGQFIIKQARRLPATYEEFLMKIKEI